MIMVSQDILAGKIYKSINAERRIAEGLPKLNWLVKNIIPKNDLTIIGGKPKVGKTRFAIGLVKCLLTGEEFLERVISEKLDMDTNKLVNNWHKYCDDLGRAALDEKTKPYAKREIIQLIHQIIKDNVLERNQNQKIEEIKDALLNRENSNGNDLINITEI